MPASCTIRIIRPEQTHALRHQVLWPDRPLSFVQLEEDAQGLHYGAFVHQEVIGVISVFSEGGIHRFRKFAVHPDYQGKGIGTALLTHVISQIRMEGGTQLWCDARVSAIPFYERLGMKPDGGIFYKGEIAYTRFRLMWNG